MSASAEPSFCTRATRPDELIRKPLSISAMRPIGSRLIDPLTTSSMPAFAPVSSSRSCTSASMSSALPMIRWPAISSLKPPCVVMVSLETTRLPAALRSKPSKVVRPLRTTVFVLNVWIGWSVENVLISSRNWPWSSTPGIWLESSVRKTRPTMPGLAPR